MRSLWIDLDEIIKRVDDNVLVPASIVNDNGKPNLNNSIADNGNDARLSAEITLITNERSYANHLSGGVFLLSLLVSLVH